MGGVKGVFRTWNWPHMPVRIFTYGVGGDAAAAHNMKDMACTNKGELSLINEACCLCMLYDNLGSFKFTINRTDTKLARDSLTSSAFYPVKLISQFYAKNSVDV